MILDLPVHVPRYAFSPRNAARAGDIWRTLQEVATEASTRCGWPPSRFNAEGLGFIVREMVCLHHRETFHGEALTAKTWVRDFRRGMFTTREVRIRAADGAPVVSAAQGWVHVKVDAGPGGPALKPMRAPDALVSAFPLADPEDPLALPGFVPNPGAAWSVVLDPWHVSMDPLGHANHPAYVDWADEAISRALAARGIDPHGLVPVAERVVYRDGVRGGDLVTVDSQVVGDTDGAVAITHRLLVGTREAAVATTLRRHVGVDLRAALG